MKKFFKPTRWKVILALVLGLTWDIAYAYSLSFFGCTLNSIFLPTLPGHAPPTPLQEINQTIQIEGPWGLYCLFMANRDFESIRPLFSLLLLLLPFLISYLISCIVIFLFAKLSKRHLSKLKK